MSCLGLCSWRATPLDKLKTTQSADLIYPQLFTKTLAGSMTEKILKKMIKLPRWF